MRPSSVPESIKDAVAKAEQAPGHSFLLYFPDITNDAISREDPKTQALKHVCNKHALQHHIGHALQDRQLAMAARAKAWSAHARAVAPFSTGLGNEHPTENGFAFLSPYGLPYLAGSGVKGVLRRAAEELLLDRDEADSPPFDYLDLWLLFGFEGVNAALWDDANGWQQRCLATQAAAIEARPEWRWLQQREPGFENLLRKSAEAKSIHYRGALDFWDVFPAFPKVKSGELLTIEIMTPHYGQYYRGESSPHDAGQPVPVIFLAIKPGASFDFYVVGHEARMPEGLRGRWRELLDRIFAHACNWSGFGAKTSVGYGALERDTERTSLIEKRLNDEKARLAEASLTPEAKERLVLIERIEKFRKDAAAEKQRGYMASRFNEPRLKFADEARGWTDTKARQLAGDVLASTLEWGEPRKDRLKDLKAIIRELRGDPGP